mgnify:FL=1
MDAKEINIMDAKEINIMDAKEMNIMDVNEINIMNAKEANFNSKKNSRKFTKELKEIGDLIESASNNGYYSLKYESELCISELYKLFKSLKNLGYKIKSPPYQFIYKFEITWFDSNLN